MNSVIILL